MFANDAALVYSCRSYDELQAQMEDDLEILKFYLDQNKLLLNVQKTNFIIFQNKQIDNIFRQISYNGEIIKRVERVSYLGLHLDPKLNFVNHINAIQNKVTPYIAVLKRIGRYLNEQAAHSIYFSHILSHIFYLNAVWGSAPESYIIPLQFLQNNAIKSIKHLNRFTPSYLLYNENILPIKQLTEYSYLLTIFKINAHLIKSNYTTLQNVNVTNRNTRNALSFRLPNYKLKNSQNSLFYRGQQLFNDLPNAIKESSIRSFKMYVKKKLFSQYLAEYSLSHIL